MLLALAVEDDLLASGSWESAFHFGDGVAQGVDVFFVVGYRSIQYSSAQISGSQSR